MVVKLKNRFSRARQAILTPTAWCVMVADAVEWRALQLPRFEPDRIRSQFLNIFYPT